MELKMKIILLTSICVISYSVVSVASENGDVKLYEKACQSRKCFLLAENTVISNYVPEKYIEKNENEDLDNEQFDEEDMQREEIENMEDMEDELVEETDAESQEKKQAPTEIKKWWQIWK